MALIVTRGTADSETRRIERLSANGQLRRLYAGIYTDDLSTEPATIARRELFSLCAILAPQALISHRSALELRPTGAGEIFLTGPYRRALTLPGLKLRVVRGPSAMPDDIAIPTRFGTTCRSCDARALLENLTRSAGDASTRRTLGVQAVENWLERLLAREGEARLNALRDHAARISSALNMARESARLDAIIGTLLGTRRAKLSAPAAVARARGRPYDDARLTLFDRVMEHLAGDPPLIPPADPDADPALAAFVESYFSNYIEGTEFELQEAHDIVVKGRPLAYREDDSHDILGTHAAILESIRRAEFPASSTAFVEQLRAWNRSVIRSRAAMRPGEIKAEPNRAGTTLFVAPDLVLGTLEQGFTRIAASGAAEVRAAMAMFVVSEVHPFAAGNGRTARLAMNLALSAAGRTRVIVPTVYRDDYLLALKALSQGGSIDPYVRMLARAAAFSRWLRLDSAKECFAQLEASNALKRPAEGRLIFP